MLGMQTQTTFANGFRDEFCRSSNGEHFFRLEVLIGQNQNFVWFVHFQKSTFSKPLALESINIDFEIHLKGIKINYWDVSWIISKAFAGTDDDF